jgi:hypothetical protein
MKNNNCVICLPVYNCEKYLISIFDNILRIKTIFDNISVIFGYDHCKDNSLNLLQEFKKTNNNLEIIILINDNPRFKYRTHNLAYIRNLMIDYMYANYYNYNFFIMMDSDDVCSKNINVDILQKHIECNNLWDSLSFNRNDYYDIWALIYKPFVHHCRSFGSNSHVVINHIKQDITNKLNNMDSKYLNVYSAFNGFAIYKLDKFVSCKYDGIKQKFFDDNEIENMINYLNNSDIKLVRKKLVIHEIKENCEHINFHIDSIKNNSKIMITNDIIFN